MFFKGRNLEWVSEPLNKHEVEEHQEKRAFKQSYNNKAEKRRENPERIVSDSRIPQASTVRYSFQDE